MKSVDIQSLDSEMKALLERGTEEVFLAPLHEAAHDWNRALRQSENGVSDEAFLKLGVHRVLRNNESGRDFLQSAIDRLKLPVQKSAFFNLFHSSRRLQIVEDTAAGLYRDACRRIETDLLKDFPQLEGMDIIAGDGHLLAAACHAKRDKKGRKVAPSSLFMLNVRNGLVFPLAAVQGDGKYEHELPVLRNHLPDFLQKQRRGHALKKVLMLLDPAFIDTVFWTNLDHAHKLGVLVIIPEKKSLNIYHYETIDFDRNDPINIGVISCELVGFENPDSATARRIVYRDPETGKTYRFLTTAMDLPPGLVALLYLLRWRIEKVFDVFKNKLHEGKAWGNGRTCQLMQAHFVCMTYNLILLLSDTLKQGFGIEPLKLYRKRENALAKREIEAEKQGGFINPLIRMIVIPSQISCQFIRSLRNAIDLRKRFREHLPDFRRTLECYL